MAINQMFDLHLWDGWLWQKKGSIHCFISTHSPATCWFIAVVYMFLVNILLFGDPRTCIDIALCFLFFFSGVHPCLLLIGCNSSACLLTRFIFSAALYRDIHSYRSRFFVMKFWIFGVHGNHCLLSGNQAWQVCSLNFPFISWIFSSPFKAPFLTPVFTWQKNHRFAGDAMFNYVRLHQWHGKGLSGGQFQISWVELASRKTEDIRLEHNLRSPRIFEFLDLKMFPNIWPSKQVAHLPFEGPSLPPRNPRDEGFHLDIVGSASEVEDVCPHTLSQSPLLHGIFTNIYS